MLFDMDEPRRKSGPPLENTPMDRKLLLRQQMRQSMENEIAARTKAHQDKLARFRSAVHARKAVGAAAPATPLVMLVSW
jgi:hypothetical protein